MTFTFDPSLSSPRDRVRQWTGDKEAATSDIADETITYYLGTGLSELATALQLCRDMMAYYAKSVDVTVDHQTTKAGTAYQNYKNLVGQLQARIGSESVGVPGFVGAFVGGIGDCRGPYDVETLPPACSPWSLPYYPGNC